MVLLGVFNNLFYTIDKTVLNMFIFFITIMCLRIILFGFEYSAYFMASIVAFSFNFNRTTYSNVLTSIAILNIILMGYEFINGSYMYVYVAPDGEVLDEVLFGGHAQVFRAKGIFAGPLSAVAFSYILLIIRRFDIYSYGIVLITSFLAYGRLGIVIGIFGIIGKLKMHEKIIGAVLLFVGLIVNKGEFQFMYLAFDPVSSNNIGRYEAWYYVLTKLINFNWYEWLIGSAYLLPQDSSVESDWLRILFTGGVSLTLAYCLIIYRLTTKKIELFLLVMIMTVFPFVQSLICSVLILNMSFYNADKN